MFLHKTLRMEVVVLNAGGIIFGGSIWFILIREGKSNESVIPGLRNGNPNAFDSCRHLKIDMIIR